MRKKSGNLVDSQTGLNRAQLIVQVTAASPILPPKGLFQFQMDNWQTLLKHTAWYNDCVREIILRGEGRANILSSVDRLQYHITALQIQLGKKILTTVCNRYGDRSRLRRRDFGFVVRAFTENGTKPMTEDEVTTLWRACKGGDRKLLTNMLFPSTGAKGKSAVKQDAWRTGQIEEVVRLQDEDNSRPEVLQGPLIGVILVIVW